MSTIYKYSFSSRLQLYSTRLSSVHVRYIPKLGADGLVRLKKEASFPEIGLITSAWFREGARNRSVNMTSLVISPTVGFVLSFRSRHREG